MKEKIKASQDIPNPVEVAEKIPITKNKYQKKTIFSIAIN